MSVVRLRADAARIPLADGSVHLCCTSPPYMALRRYDSPAQTREWADGTRAALGNEPTPDLFVAHLVECFREVRRVLRDDGVAAVVIGDSYGRGKRPAWKGDAVRGANRRKAWDDYPEGAVGEESVGLDGNLLLIPYRFALAMQADGWTLRAETIWAKALSFCPTYSGSTMPESLRGWAWRRCRVKVASAAVRFGQGSVLGHLTPDGRPIGSALAAQGHPERQPTWRDCPGCPRCTPNDGLVLRRGSWRPTRAHEAVFVFAKAAAYYGDGIAVEERAVSTHGSGNGYRREGRESYADSDGPRGNDETWEPSPDASRNLRDVWAISPAKFSGSNLTGGKVEHYATFPEAIVEPLVRAFTSDRGVCRACGAPWARVVERGANGSNAPAGGGPKAEASQREREAGGIGRLDGGRRAQPGGAFNNNPSERPPRPRTHGWRATCDHGAPVVPCAVIDPFAGSGTVGAVAARLGRRAALCDLSQSYLRDIAPSRVGRAALAGQVSSLGAATQADLW